MKISQWIEMRLGLLLHPQFYSNPFAAIWRRLIWILYARHQPIIKFSTEFGFKLQGQPKDIGVGSLFYRGQYEWGELVLWRKLLKQPNLVVLDIGANLGLYSLFTAAYCRKHNLSGAKIFSFEPNPKEYTKLKANIDFNNYSEVEALQLALSDREGFCKMEIPPDGLGVFGHLLNSESNSSANALVMEVETTSLDSWCKNIGIEQIDLIKIDVEGHELETLLGAKNLLSNHAIRILIMEVGHGEWRSCLNLLSNYGYAIDLIYSDGSIKPFEEANLKGWDNVIASPNGLHRSY